MPDSAGVETAQDEWWFDRITPDLQRERIGRELAREVPVALEYNGVGYAVLMATPADLVDLAYGFSFSERLALAATDILATDVHQTENGFIVRVNLAGPRAGAVFARVRHRVSDSSCGLCGVENLEQALRPLPRVEANSKASPADIFHALEHLRGMQSLNARTGAVHAAALCAADGDIRLVREDVGRHNAFDKLIGAMARDGLGWDRGFALLSSRCSYELVEKAVLSACPLLATISAPTELAARKARGAGLPLAVLARPDAMLLSGRDRD